VVLIFATQAIVDPGAQEFRAGIKDEVAVHFFPDKLEFIMVAPDIVSGAGNDVLTGGRNKDG